jgi:hypothetical protein
MKVGDLVRFKNDRADYKEFHGHMGLVIGIEEVVNAYNLHNDSVLHLAVRWIAPVLFNGTSCPVSHFAAYRYEVIE